MSQTSSNQRSFLYLLYPCHALEYRPLGDVNQMKEVSGVYRELWSVNYMPPLLVCCYGNPSLW